MYEIIKSSIKQKNILLTKIRAMGKLDEKFVLLINTLSSLANHYDRNQQFHEDPGLSVLRNVSDILNSICQLKKLHSPQKGKLLDCSSVVLKYAPELSNDIWSNRFQKPKQLLYVFRKYHLQV